MANFREVVDACGFTEMTFLSRGMSLRMIMEER